MDNVELFKNLVVMAAADRSFTRQEVEYLTQRAGRLGISSEEFDAAVTGALEPDAALTLPPSHQERVTLLRELIQVMGADGHLADTEKELLAVAAAKMGLANDELNEIIDSVV